MQRYGLVDGTDPVAPTYQDGQSLAEAAAEIGVRNGRRYKALQAEIQAIERAR
jgi:hypothetical protein